ncbi:type II 3-dehydroquinate dehydratase [bacterium]|nr:type II 3-dehydroquinate dehydratase [candidate division CSSED10-310 bacterium]
MTEILVIHGPNLNRLGDRETGHYGTLTLEAVNMKILEYARQLGLKTDIRQSNDEGDIITWIQDAHNRFGGIVLNPAGFGYSSVAIRDAIILAGIPVVEVHLSNIHARERFRHHTLTSAVCIGQITGFKEYSYLLGLKAIYFHLRGEITD